MKNKLLTFLILSVSILSLNCGNNIEEETKAEEHSESEEFVEITTSQMNAADIKLGSFEKRNLRTSVKANGVLELPPQNKANVSALLGGIVKNILVTEGDFVKENQTLALLEHPQFIEIQQEYIENINKFSFLEKEYERKKKLFNENIASGKEFQQTEAEYNSTKAKINALNAKLNMLNLPHEEISKGNIFTDISVKAPIHGYVRNIKVNIGAYAEPQKDMFEIVDNHHIHIDLLVYETDINKIKKGQKVIFQVANIGNKELEAKIFAVGKSFEEDLKAVRIHAEIENPDNELIPGMYVDGRIIVDNYETNTLSESAIIREGETSYIFIASSEEHYVSGNSEEESNDEEHINFKKVQIKTGVTENGFTEILSLAGSNENVNVVTKGAYYLESEMSKGEAEHNH